MTLDEQIADKEAIANAHRDLARLRMRRSSRDRKRERQAWTDKARELDPEYDRKLESARAAMVEAQAAVDEHEAARQRVLEQRRAQRDPDGRQREHDESDNPTMMIESGIVAGKPRIVGAFLPKPTPRHVAALAELNAAQGHLRRLERWPAELEQNGGVIGETTEERIARTPRIRLGMRGPSADMVRRLADR